MKHSVIFGRVMKEYNSREQLDSIWSWLDVLMDGNLEREKGLRWADREPCFSFFSKNIHRLINITLSEFEDIHFLEEMWINGKWNWVVRTTWMQTTAYSKEILQPQILLEFGIHFSSTTLSSAHEIRCERMKENPLMGYELSQVGFWLNIQTFSIFLYIYKLRVWNIHPVTTTTNNIFNQPTTNLCISTIFG